MHNSLVKLRKKNEKVFDTLAKENNFKVRYAQESFANEGFNIVYQLIV